MTPLANAVYDILRRRVRQDDPRITYKELASDVRETSAAFEHITHRSPALYAALCEIGAACERLKLPPLPALVVRADTRRPGDAYYEGMSDKFRGERVAQWRRDLAAVKKAKYPRRISARGQSETEYLLSSPRNAKRLLAAVRWARAT